MPSSPTIVTGFTDAHEFTQKYNRIFFSFDFYRLSAAVEHQPELVIIEIDLIQEDIDNGAAVKGIIEVIRKKLTISKWAGTLYTLSCPVSIWGKN